MATPQTTTGTTKIPWKTRLILSMLSTLTDSAIRSDGTVNRRLLRVFDFRSPATPTSPRRGVTSFDHTIDPSRNLWFRLFIPATSTQDPLPVLFFFHGGGFAFLSPSSYAYDSVCRVFARKLPAVVISVNYRLTPEHRYPSQYDDGFDVLTFVDQNHSSLIPSNVNVDVSKCFVGGDSAGANLAHHVALRYCQSSSLFKELKVIGLIAIQPFFGGEERTESEIRMPNGPIVSVDRTDWLWKAFLPEGSNRDHEAINVSGPNAVDLTKLEFPATVVVIAGLDPLQDWQRGYYQWLRKSGKEAELMEYPNMFHAFYLFPELPEAAQLITQLNHFVTDRISKL